MKTIKKVENRFAVKRKAYLKEIASIGPFVEGTLVSIPRKNCAHIARNLTFKVKRKTKTVYVPIDRANEVIQWTKEYRKLKKLIKSVTKMSLAILQNHVRMKRAEKRKSQRQRHFKKIKSNK